MSFRAHETADRLYVVGAAHKHAILGAAHIDVQLLSENGGLIAERQDDIAPSQPQPGGGQRSRETYVASFPLADARKAAKIRIIYHQSPHWSAITAAQRP